MKKFILLFFIFLWLCFGTEQKKVDEWTSMVQSLNVENKRNWKFRASAKIRKEGNKDSQCAIWARVDKVDNSAGFFENQAYSDINVTSEWKNSQSKVPLMPMQNFKYQTFAKGNGDFILMIFSLK